MCFKKNLFTTAAVVCAVAVSGVQAQSTPTTPTYNYSVTVTTSVPKGSAAETAVKSKSNPANVKYTPCDASAKDQLAFTIKYDAGTASPNTLKNLYVFLKSPRGEVFSVNRGNLNTPISLVAVTTTAPMPTAAYTTVANNLGGVQTEVLFGGAIPLEGLETGLWSVTGIVSDAGGSALANNPASWAAWDSVPFMVGAPWPGVGAAATCS